MTYETKITNIEKGKEYVRGYELTQLIGNMSFGDAIFLLLKGEKPTDSESTMMNALLVAAIDHGPGTASAQSARISASAKADLSSAVAAGVLSMGPRHGFAIEGAAHFFSEHKDAQDLPTLLSDLKEKKIRVPGYGHAVLDVDHRSERLFELASDLGIAGANVAFAKRVHKELNNISSKTLPINIDGAMAAVSLDMGFASADMKGFFLIARTPGLVAQVREEQESGGRLRRVAESDVHYVGKDAREF